MKPVRVEGENRGAVPAEKTNRAGFVGPQVDEHHLAPPRPPHSDQRLTAEINTATLAMGHMSMPPGLPAFDPNGQQYEVRHSLSGVAVVEDAGMQQDVSYTVTQLVAAFRQALVALVPIVEAVGLTWRDGEAYDDWDLIEGTLFEVLVAAGVRGDVDAFGTSKPFPAYGFADVSYADCSWIEVNVPEEDGTFALIRLNSPREFGDVAVVRLNTRGDPAGEPTVVPWTVDREFLAQLRSPDGTLTRADVVTPSEGVGPMTGPFNRTRNAPDQFDPEIPPDPENPPPPEVELEIHDRPFRDQVMLSVRRHLSLDEELLTAALRGVSVNPRGPNVEGRFIYASPTGYDEWENVNQYETYLSADFQHPVTFSFIVEYRPPQQFRTLLPGEEWAYLRREPDLEYEEAVYRERQKRSERQWQRDHSVSRMAPPSPPG